MGIIFTSEAGRQKMRACFLGQNICNLGYGVASLQAPPLLMDQPVRPPSEAEKHVIPAPGMGIPDAPIGSRPVAIPQRLEA
jgi:hypothetical protein